MADGRQRGSRSESRQRTTHGRVTRSLCSGRHDLGAIACGLSMATNRSLFGADRGHSAKRLASLYCQNWTVWPGIISVLPAIREPGTFTIFAVDICCISVTLAVIARVATARLTQNALTFAQE